MARLPNPHAIRTPWIAISSILFGPTAIHPARSAHLLATTRVPLFCMLKLHRATLLARSGLNFIWQPDPALPIAYETLLDRQASALREHEAQSVPLAVQTLPFLFRDMDSVQVLGVRPATSRALLKNAFSVTALFPIPFVMALMSSIQEQIGALTPTLTLTHLLPCGILPL